MHSVVTTTVSDDTEDEEEEEEDIVEPEEEKSGTDASFNPIIVPSMSYLAQVPSKTQPELRALEEAKARPCRDRVDEKVLEEAEVDDNVRNLIIRLSSSTARDAFLANRLADIHRRIATEISYTDHNDTDDKYGTPVTSEDEDDISRSGSVDSLVLACTPPRRPS